MRIHIIGIVLLALLASPALAALTPNNPNLNASLLYYEPVPALPGTLLDVFVQIENNGAAAQRVTVEFIDSHPFSIDSERDRVKQTGSIPAQESFLAKYKVRVSEHATPGTNYIRIKHYAGTDATAQITILPIDVFAPTAGLSIEDLRISPAVLVPGREGTVSFAMRNLAAYRIAEGTVKLDLAGVDIIPAGSTNQQRFAGMAEGTSREFSFRIIPSPDLKPGVYKIPLTINYSDQRGNKHQLSETIGVTVGATPDVTVVIDETTLSKSAANGEIIFRVTNKGLGEVKFANLAIRESDAFRLLSSGSSYVGNIDSDDYKTARVRVARSGSEEEMRIPIILTYSDALNNPYEHEEILLLRLPEDENGGIGGWAIAAFVAAILIGGYALLRRKRR